MSSNRKRGQFECGMTWFCVCFNFVCSHAQCDCCAKLCWKEWGRVYLKWGVQDQRDGKMLGVDGERVGGSWELENFTESLIADFD